MSGLPAVAIFPDRYARATSTSASARLDRHVAVPGPAPALASGPAAALASGPASAGATRTCSRAVPGATWHFHASHAAHEGRSQHA